MSQAADASLAQPALIQYCKAVKELKSDHADHLKNYGVADPKDLLEQLSLVITMEVPLIWRASVTSFTKKLMSNQQFFKQALGTDKSQLLG